jgi:hypothetical protein
MAGDFLDPPPLVRETSLHKVFLERDHSYEIAKKSQQQFKGNTTLLTECQPSTFLHHK